MNVVLGLLRATTPKEKTMTAQPGTAHYAATLKSEYNALKREYRAAMASHRFPVTAADLMETVSLADALAAFETIGNSLKWGETPEGRDFNRRADAYNARVAAHRRELQAQVNTRKAAKTQAASCGDCYTVHAGGCY
jgi:hypothetical protein